MGDLFEVAGRFNPRGTVIDVQEFGNGNINSTFLVTLDSGVDRNFILQRINTRVFLRPERIMSNMRIATEHAHMRLRSRETDRRWEVPRVLSAKDGRDHWLDSGGSFWRATSFIQGARSFDTIRDSDHAKEAGHALGMFHALLSDMAPGRLSDTLEGFHIAPRYLRHYDEVSAGCGTDGSAEAAFCMRFVDERRELVHVLENAKAEGRLVLRTIHGDPKVNNIMMDTITGQAVGIVDLDTVKPGLVHYDIGDCLRSGCNPLGEETGKWEAVSFDTALCRSVLEGYLTAAGKFLTRNDFDYIFDSVRLIAFELGLRFFTDHLEGDVYFKARRPGHNLARALVQFRLTESIEAQEAAIRSIVRDLR